jgi:hypothetical protein
LWYPGFAAPVTYPMPQGDTIRAVTFWKWTQEEWEYLEHRGGQPDSTPGVSWGQPVFVEVVVPDTLIAFIPLTTQRCLLNTAFFDSMRSWYYYGDLARWQRDFDIVARLTVAHEFGHTVGMLDTLDTQHTTGIMCDRGKDSHGFVVLASDSAYSDTSRSQFSVKGSLP